jgi:site-specific DNA recombinase
MLSIEAQLTELKEFAAKEKLEIAASFTEAKTAKEPGRMKFEEMLSRIEAGEADGILSWHPDRLARNSVDGGKIIYLVDTGKIKSLKFPTFWFEDTPQGKFMLNIAFGQSKYYIDNLSENVKRGIRQKLRRGEYPGWAPMGYLNDYKTRKIVLNPEKHKLMKKMFELYASGNYSMQELCDKFNSLGMRTPKNRKLRVSIVQYLLKNPFFYGVFLYRGEIHQGAHEPIITKKLFDQCQEIMQSRTKRRKKIKHDYPLIGFMACGTCGCAITAERQKGHIYYRCTKKKGKCEEKYMREELLTEQLKGEIQKVSLPNSDTDQMLEWLNKEELDKKKTVISAIQNLQRQKQKAESKLDILLDSHLDGVIDKNIYLEKNNKLMDELVNIFDKIKEIKTKGNNWLEPMRDFILSVKKAKKTAENRDLREFKSFLKNIGSNFILKDKKF